MQVQDTQPYISPSKTYKTQARLPNIDGDPKAVFQSNAFVATDTVQSISNVVTGTTGSRLSAETTAELMKSSQQASTSAPASPLSKAVQHGLDSIANDPKYATTRAKVLGTAPELLAVSKLPETPSEMSQAYAMRDDLAVAFKQRETVYNSKRAEGLPPAQVYAEMLAFQITQSEHNARADHYQGDPAGTRSNRLKAEYTYLQNAIAQGTSNKTTG